MAQRAWELGAQQEPAEPAGPRSRWANAWESAAAAVQHRTYAHGGWGWAIVMIWNFKPGDYTRHLYLPPGIEEGSWAPGHPETRGKKKI